jgi:hypothetical protein
MAARNSTVDIGVLLPLLGAMSKKSDKKLPFNQIVSERFLETNTHVGKSLQGSGV